MIRKPDDFCAFILTHGRPESVITHDTLRKQGYTGKIYFIVDDADKTLDAYKKKFGKDVIVFSKAEYAVGLDIGDNFPTLRGVNYARNACFDIAKRLGYKYFIELDDDYTAFRYRMNQHGGYADDSIRNMDAILWMMLEFYKKTPALSVAMAQGGDFIGGKNSGFAKVWKPRRKCMNTFFCSTERPFLFVSRMNDDVTTYLSLGRRGNLFLTIPQLVVMQRQTQSAAGGLTEMYLDMGTYVKSFYSVVFTPSCVKVSEMGTTNRRLHHKTNWDKAVPMIVSEELRRFNV